MSFHSYVHDAILELSCSKENRLSPDCDEPAFSAPLVGTCAGDDPIWDKIVDDIGDFHWTPASAISLAYPGETFRPGELSVIAWVLPQTKATRTDHRDQSCHPSKRWSQARHYGENFNEWMRVEFAGKLRAAGIQAAAPTKLPQWTRQDSDRHGYASTWSERHAAFASGLGTFGLSDGLITRAGKAVRVGSVVARLTLPHEPRAYGDNHRAWCRHFNGLACLACAKRCPAKAISQVGHDKVACRKYIREVTAPYVQARQLGFKVNSCGLCQTRVPCESSLPAGILE